MNILCIDPTASFLDFAMRAEAQGHHVRVWMGPDQKEGNARFTVGDGLVDKLPGGVNGWKPSARWADLILVSDNCKYMRDVQSLHDQGFPVFSMNCEVTRWEMERDYGQSVFEEAGIACLPAVRFKNVSEARAYQLTNMDKRFVSKPNADVSKALSYVSKSPDDMLFMLDYWEKHSTVKCPFIFQEFFPGTEMAVGGWVGPNGFSQYFLENFEFKKLMNDDKGCNTGEQGTVMKYVTAEESQLAREMLLPLEMRLVREGYRGYIDVAVMISDKGEVRPLEFTSRHGWPLFQIQQALHPDVCEWMLDLLQGHDTFQPYRDIATGVVVTIPDFPYSHMSRKEVSGYPVWGITSENRFNVHPCEMKLGEGYVDGKKQPMMVTAGDYILVGSGTGTTVRSASDRAYRLLDQLEIPNSPMYRTDIGCRLEKQLPKLQRNGYATAWEYA